MGPIDYSTQVQQPIQAAAQGYQLGAGIRDDQQHQAVLAQQQAVQQQQAAVINNLISNPNASAQDYANATLLVPALREQFGQAWSTKNAAQTQAHISDLSQWGAAIQQGQPKVASDAMRARADAMDATSGQPTQASQAMRHQADAIDAHPDFAGVMIKSLLAAQGDQGAKVVDQLRLLKRDPDVDRKTAAEADTAQAGADVATATVPADITAKILKNKDVQSQIDQRTNQFALDKDKFRSELGLKTLELQDKLGTLPEYVANGVTSAQTESVAASQSAAKMTDLAARLEAANPNSGLNARFGEAWARTFGSQDEVNRIRAEYNRLVTPAAMAAYKTVATGSTSDKDIETAMTGVPPPTANVETMTSFLRGAAKLQVYDSVLNNAKSEWLQSVKSLGKSKNDINVDGVTVPAGTTFKAFTDAYVQKKVAAQVNANELATRGYMKYATPVDAAPAPVTDAMTGGAAVVP